MCITFRYRHSLLMDCVYNSEPSSSAITNEIFFKLVNLWRYICMEINGASECLDLYDPYVEIEFLSGIILFSFSAFMKYD